MRLLQFLHTPKFWEDFEQWLNLEPPNTARTRRTTLADFLSFNKLKLNTNAAAAFIGTAQPQHVLNYLSYLKQTGRSPGTINTRYGLLMGLFAWAFASGYRDQPLAVHYKASREKTRQSQFIDPQIVLKEIDKAATDGTFDGLRFAVFCTLMFYGALRLSEALGLKIKDVGIVDGITMITIWKQKGRKTSAVEISPERDYLIHAWIKELYSRGYGPPDPLIPDVSTSTLQRRYNKTFGTGCHSARATSITLALQASYTIDEVQDFARLASVQTVRVYDRRSRAPADSPGAKLQLKRDK